MGKNKSANRRPQTQKDRAEVRRIQELRRSAASSPRPSGNDYKRKPKHKEW